MCAITGLISQRPDLPRLIQRMTAALRHRGPDDEGYLLVSPEQTLCLGGEDTPPEGYRSDATGRPVGNILNHPGPAGTFLALGHRRLSILDLSPLGHQPMGYDSKYWIVYNGEIYNYLELRLELEALGCRFVSHSDTEVALTAFDRWGPACLARFNGMWGLAIYDSHRRQLFLARDRFGVKPLYYWINPELFAFASEIKAFTVLPGWQAVVNGQAVHDYLTASLQDHSRETMFAGVYQLEPGACVTIDCRDWPRRTEALATQRWYQLQPREFMGDFPEAAGEFRSRFLDAVKLRLRSDVPVGSCLSGGLDSSSIVCAARSLLNASPTNATQKTFSACSEIKRFDERDYIEQVVAATGVESHYVFPSLDNLRHVLETLIWHQDEPFATTSIYAQWMVFQAAHEADVKVMLDGQGADELLCGYPNFYRAFYCGLVRSGLWRVCWGEMAARRGKFRRVLSGLLRAVTDAAMPLVLQRRFRKSAKNTKQLAWLGREQLDATYPGRLAAGFQAARSAGELSRELMCGAHMQALLHWEDRNSMAHGIESRVPFLDYRLVEFALGLPDHFKIRQGVTKAVLRSGMQGLVPEPILERRDKMGFVTPEEVWVKQTGVDWFRQMLAGAVEASQGILTAQAVPVLEAAIAGTQAYESVVWRMICLGAWMRQFKVSS